MNSEEASIEQMLKTGLIADFPALEAQQERKGKQLPVTREHSTISHKIDITSVVVKDTNKTSRSTDSLRNLKIQSSFKKKH
jgi:hypothetical protein